MLAAAGGHIGMMKRLLERGADTNRMGWGSGTALHVAARSRKKEIAEFPQEAGADKNVKDVGRTALQAIGLADRVDGWSEMGEILRKWVTRHSQPAIRPIDPYRTYSVNIYIQNTADSMGMINRIRHLPLPHTPLVKLAINRIRHLMWPPTPLLGLMNYTLSTLKKV